MGWLLKIGLFFVAIIAAAFSAWIITGPILALLFVPPLLNKKGNKKSTPNSRQSRISGGGIVTAAGALLLLLSFVAFISGGVFSPIVFTLLGFALLVRHTFSIHVSGRVKPVAGSILLRRGLLPFGWSALAEAKVSTRNVEGALSGVNERLLIAAEPSPRIFLAFSTKSPSRTKAEENLVKRMQTMARALGPLGVYLLPLDSAEAANAVSVHAVEVEPPTEDVHRFISTADYGVAAVEAEHGFVTGFELYTRPDPELNVMTVLSGTRGNKASQLTLREFLREALQRTGAPQPDRYTAFLSSMAATEGENLGQRITQTEGGAQEQVLLVSSIGNPRVELTRPQLRAVAKIYE